MVLNMDYSPVSNANRTYRDRVAYLEAKVSYLNSLLKNLTSPLFDPKLSMGELEHFAPMERRLLCVFHTNLGKFVKHKALLEALYAFDDNPPEDGNVIKVYVSKMRKKLAHYDILCDHGVGYALIKKTPGGPGQG